MRETVKDLVKSTAISIGMAMTIFCLVGVVFDVGYKGNFSLDDYRFTKMVAGCVLVGLGFGVPTIVYRKDNLPMPIRVIIHMGISFIWGSGAWFIRSLLILLDGSAVRPRSGRES